MQAENVLKSLVFNGWKHFHVIIQPGMQDSNTHLTIEERRIIRTGIDNGSTKTAIATTIGKDNSIVGKEIKLHRHLVQKCKLPFACL